MSSQTSFPSTATILQEAAGLAQNAPPANRLQILAQDHPDRSVAKRRTGSLGHPEVLVGTTVSCRAGFSPACSNCERRPFSGRVDKPPSPLPREERGRRNRRGRGALGLDVLGRSSGEKDAFFFYHGATSGAIPSPITAGSRYCSA